jgi:UDP-glucose 6-dehydrogenase
VLVGTDGAHPGPLREFYATIHDRRVFVTTIKTAELTKVAYNTFIGLKIAFANTMMELCEKTGADVDDLISALSTARGRLMGPAYLRGGMGDGGGCFPPGELVMTADGPRPIKTIREGDLVLSGDGTLQPVLKTWKRWFDGDLISVKVEGLLETQMTSDHPVIAREDLRDRYKSGRRRTDIAPLSDAREVDADELIVGRHRLTWPRAGVSWNSPMPPPHATDEYLELAGWWLAEGSAEFSDRRGRVRFDLHADEHQEAERIGELLVACAPPRRSGRGGNATLSHSVIERRRAVRFGSMKLTEMLVSDFGKGARDKRLPGWVLWSGERSAALVLSGMVKGDGHVNDNGIAYATISPDLAWGAMVLMANLGVNPTIREVPARLGHQRSYEVRVRNRREARELAQKIGVEFSVHGHHETKSQSWRPVRSLRRDAYSGPVHNLWVAGENTYVVGCGVVHNCHPRDNIALSWLAREVNLSFDLFEALMICREKQTEWLAELVEAEAGVEGVEILGKAYKPETALTVGSPATLLANILYERDVKFIHKDPVVDV